MNDHLNRLIKRYAAKGLLLDSNVLLLYIVGLTDKSQVGRFKRTANSGFTAQDFNLLESFVLRFTQVVTLPYILAEVSNFVDTGDKLGRMMLETLATQIGVFYEPSIRSMDVAPTKGFTQFGLTDAAIFLAAQNRYLVLTKDMPLWAFLYNSGVAAVNFNNLREYLLDE